jgi:phage shock protein A
MGLFTRLGDILRANINGLLDRVENPERMLAQIIREMEEGLVTARQQAAAAVASERRLTREREQNRAAADTWKARALVALDAGREDLARRAVARHLEYADLAGDLEAQERGARQLAAEVQTALHTLESRLAEARRRQRLFHSRQQAARVRAQVAAAADAPSLDPRSPFARFARLENRLAELEDDLLAHAQAAGPRDAEAEVIELEADRRITEAIVILKKEKANTGLGDVVS